MFSANLRFKRKELLVAPLGELATRIQSSVQGVCEADLRLGWWLVELARKWRGVKTVQNFAFVNSSATLLTDLTHAPQSLITFGDLGIDKIIPLSTYPHTAAIMRVSDGYEIVRGEFF